MRNVGTHEGTRGQILNHQSTATVTRVIGLHIAGEGCINDADVLVRIDRHPGTAHAGILNQPVVADEAAIQRQLTAVNINSTAVLGGD